MPSIIDTLALSCAWPLKICIVENIDSAIGGTNGHKKTRPLSLRLHFNWISFNLTRNLSAGAVSLINLILAVKYGTVSVAVLIREFQANPDLGCVSCMFNSLVCLFWVSFFFFLISFRSLTNEAQWNVSLQW